MNHTGYQIWLAGLFCFLNAIAFGVSSETIDLGKLQAHVANTKQKVIEHVMATGQRDMANILQKTEVIFSEDMKLPSIGYAIDDDDRVVLISAEFIDALNNYLPTLSAVLPTELNQQHLALDAVTDILLHELGHHATDSFYGHRASPYKIQFAEQTAESWSLEIKEALGLDTENIGKLIALSAAYVHQKAKYNNKGDSHSEFSNQMLKQRFDMSCFVAHSQAAAYYCDSLDNAVEDLLKTQ